MLVDISPKLIGPESYPVKIDTYLVNSFKIKIYSPNNEEKKPIVLYYHGGGWVIGSIRAYDRILRYISYNANCVVIAIEYRKAPEYKFPTALLDSYLGYCWVINNIARFNGDLNQLFLCGDSAGGNLVLGLLKILNKQADIIPSQMILIYPLVEARIILNSKWKENSLLYKISKKLLNYSLNQYLSNYTEYSSPCISHITKFDTHLYYPKTLIITGELDALTPSINEYAEKLKSGGIDVIVKEYPNVLHGFLNFYKISRQSRLALQDIVNYIKNNSNPTT